MERANIYTIGSWIAAGAAVGLSAGAAMTRDYDPPSKWRWKAKRPKSAAAIKRRAKQKAQRLARRKNRQ